MSHAQALRQSLAGTPGRDCHQDLLPVGSTGARHYFFCGACKRAVVLDAHGDVITTYRLGPVSELAARLFARLDAWFPDVQD